MGYGAAGGPQLHDWVATLPPMPADTPAGCLENSLGGQEDGDAGGQGAAGGQLRVDQQQLVSRGLELRAGTGRQAVAGEAGLVGRGAGKLRAAAPAASGLQEKLQ
jgi:hypothetical protein